jgi:hypothetical protein
VLAAVLKIGDGQMTVRFSELPDVVSGLLAAVALLGFFVTLNIIAMRMEMILYARTINLVRRYFAELNRQGSTKSGALDLVPYLVLPTSDAKPPFFESWRAMFWQVVMIGALDGLLLMAATQSLFRLGWLWSMVIGAAYGLLHLLVYFLLAQRRNREWTVKFAQSLGSSQD